jgi:hypothetical protein
MGKENKRRFWIDGWKGVMGWTGTLFVCLFAFFEPIAVFSQTWKAATPINPSATPRVTPHPSPTRVPKLAKPHKRPKSMGVSSAIASEKYVRKVVLEFSKEQFSKLLKEDGGSGYVEKLFQSAATQRYEGQFDYGFSFRVDEMENMYLIFQNSIKVFDAKGNRIRNINKDQQENRVSVDEDGNVWIYSTGTPGMSFHSPSGELIVVPQQRIIGPDGKLIANPELKDWSVMRYAKFSHGMIYSEKNGDVYFKIPGADEKNIRSTVIESKQQKQNTKFPLVIDGFSIGEDVKIDNAGNIYKRYRDSDDSTWPPYEISHLYKFDSQGHLLAGFNFLPEYINPQTQIIYHWEFDPDHFRIVKWEKTNP